MAGSLVADILGPHWQTLSSTQQIAWAFAGNARRVTTQRAESYALYSFQYFVNVNSDLAILGDSYIIDDPPTDFTPPQTFPLSFAALPHRSRFNDAATKYPGWAYLYASHTIPAAVGVIIRHLQRTPTKTTGRRQTGNHVTFMLPGESGAVNLQVPRGYYANSAGSQDAAKTRGGSALRRRFLPALRADFVNLNNGVTTTRTINNPHPPQN